MGSAGSAGLGVLLVAVWRGSGLCHPRVLCRLPADRLSARGGRDSAGGGLLLGQRAGVRDQPGRRDVYEESGEGQPGPREHLRDDGGEVPVLRQVLGLAGSACCFLPPRQHHRILPFTPLTQTWSLEDSWCELDVC